MAINLPKFYTSDAVLTNDTFIIPKLMWALPPPQRWAYVDRFERLISERVMQVFGGTLVSQTVGFDPGYDVTWDTPYGLVDVEVKTTSRHSKFIEAFRTDQVASGLTATKSHLYMHISINNPRMDDPTCMERTVKVRLYSTHFLQSKFMEALENGAVRRYPGSDLGPGVGGFDIKYEHTHCWVGDLTGVINEYGDVFYNMAAWERINPSAQRELRGIMIGVLRNDPNYTYEHKDFE